jgi:hypothetical protein
MNNHRTARSKCLLAVTGIFIACSNSGNQPRTFAADSNSGGALSANGGGGANVGGAPSDGASGGNSSTAAPATGGVPNVSGVGGRTGTGGVPYVPPSSSIALPYTDDFEDGNLDGWLVMNNSSSALGSWAVGTDGANHILQQTNSGSSATWQVGGDVKWTDQKLSVRVRWADTSTYIYISVRFNNADGYYYLQAVPGSKPKIRLRNSGSTTDVCAGSTNFAGVAGTWYTITVTAQGSTFSADIDGTAICSASNPTFANGGIALGTDGGPAAFDDVNVSAP